MADRGARRRRRRASRRRRGRRRRAAAGRCVSRRSSATRSRSGNSDSWRTSDRPEKPTPTRRIGPISIGSSSSRRAVAISVAASAVAYGSVADRVSVLMSDFFSLTVTVRAPRPSLLQTRVGVLADRTRGVAQLVQRRQVLGERGLGADLLGLERSRRPAGRRCPGPAGAARARRSRPSMSATSASASAAKRADGVDAEPVQLLLGDRADAPQPAHRQPVEQRALLVPAHHPDAVGLGQPRGDLGDLLARAGADRGHQAGLVAHPGPQVLAERLDLARRWHRRVRRARRTPRRRRAVRGRARRRGRCRAPGGWPRRRPRRAAAAPPRARRPADGPDASASPTARRTPGPRSWPRRPPRARRARRPAPAARAASAGSAARRTRRTRPCRSAAPTARPQPPMLGR